MKVFHFALYSNASYSVDFICMPKCQPNTHEVQSLYSYMLKYLLSLINS